METYHLYPEKVFFKDDSNKCNTQKLLPGTGSLLLVRFSKESVYPIKLRTTYWHKNRYADQLKRTDLYGLLMVN